MGDACRFAQGLGRRAAGVHAGATQPVALHKGYGLTSPGKAHRKRRGGLPRADDDAVEFPHVLSVPCFPFRHSLLAHTSTYPS